MRGLSAFGFVSFFWFSNSCIVLYLFPNLSLLKVKPIVSSIITNIATVSPYTLRTKRVSITIRASATSNKKKPIREYIVATKKLSKAMRANLTVAGRFADQANSLVKGIL